MLKHLLILYVFLTISFKAFCANPYESYIITTPDSGTPHFFVMTPDAGKNAKPRGRCYRVDEKGKFHLKWEIEGFSNGFDALYLGPWGEVLARLVEQDKIPTGDETMLELFKNGKLMKRYKVKDFIKNPKDNHVISAVCVDSHVDIVEWKNAEEIPQFVNLTTLLVRLGIFNSPMYEANPKLEEFRQKFVFTFVTHPEGERFIINIEDGSILAHWKVGPNSEPLNKSRAPVK